MSDAPGRVQRLERMLEISRELTSTVALEPLLDKIDAMAADLTDSEGASILLQDKRTGELRFCTAVGVPPGQLADIPVPIEGSIAGMVLTSREPLIVPDAQADPRHYGEVGQQSGLEVRSLLAVPLQIQERCIGVLEAVRGNGIGTCLLLESMRHMRELGTPTAMAGWAETDFYLKNGWHISRQWAPFQKAL